MGWEPSNPGGVGLCGAGGQTAHMVAPARAGLTSPALATFWLATGAGRRLGFGRQRLLAGHGRADDVDDGRERQRDDRQCQHHLEPVTPAAPRARATGPTGPACTSRTTSRCTARTTPAPRRWPGTSPRRSASASSTACATTPPRATSWTCLRPCMGTRRGTGRGRRAAPGATLRAGTVRGA